MAVDAIRKGAKANNASFIDYGNIIINLLLNSTKLRSTVFRGNDPSLNVVLLEDIAAVMGVGIAFGCMGLSCYTGSHIPDAIGSCMIGTLLAGVSGFIVYSNSAALVGQ